MNIRVIASVVGMIVVIGCKGDSEKGTPPATTPGPREAVVAATPSTPNAAGNQVAPAEKAGGEQAPAAAPAPQAEAGEKRLAELDDAALVRLLHDAPMFKKPASERPRISMGMCQLAYRTDFSVDCFVRKGYLALGPHAGFNNYPVSITPEGAKYLRLAKEACVASHGKYIEPKDAKLDFKIEGRQTKEDVLKVIFSIQLRLSSAVEPCYPSEHRIDLQKGRFVAELEKFDTGWVINKIQEK